MRCELPFGGLHVLFTGDFYQLPPVAGFGLYTPCESLAYEKSQQGRKLWEQVN